MTKSFRPSMVLIDSDAIAHNARLLAKMVAPAKLCAVVKADGYGHGAVTVANAALAGGAAILAVALIEEAAVLRDAGIDAPILLLSEPPRDAFEQIVELSLTPTVYSHESVAALTKAVSRAGSGPISVHVKVDTGMHRVGCDEDELIVITKALSDSSELVFEGLWSHLSVADDLDDPYTATQLHRLMSARDLVGTQGVVPDVLHIANSAGAIAHPAARLDMVRCGIALYGYLPASSLASTFAQEAAAASLRPAMSLVSKVHAVKDLEAGECPSYGRVYELGRASRIATVPLGYADGIPRRLQQLGGQVLIRGVRRPFAGTITMDQVVIDCGTDPVEPGDEVVFIGRQGDEEILATEWADLLGTISYEILCDIGPRVPRVVVSS